MAASSCLNRIRERYTRAVALLGQTLRQAEIVPKSRMGSLLVVVSSLVNLFPGCASGMNKPPLVLSCSTVLRARILSRRGRIVTRLLAATLGRRVEAGVRARPSSCRNGSRRASRCCDTPGTRESEELGRAPALRRARPMLLVVLVLAAFARSPDRRSR